MELNNIAEKMTEFLNRFNMISEKLDKFEGNHIGIDIESNLPILKGDVGNLDILISRADSGKMVISLKSDETDKAQVIGNITPTICEIIVDMPFDGMYIITSSQTINDCNIRDFEFHEEEYIAVAEIIGLPIIEKIIEKLESL